ncbi:MAG: hypothetical protein RLZZ524_1396 [Pseudomonadota bacterium]|jgi:hypothetical protein
MPGYGFGNTLAAAYDGANRSMDRFTARQDHEREVARQAKADQVAAEELDYERGRRTQDDQYTDWRRGAERQSFDIEQKQKELERRGLAAMQRAAAGDFSEADTMATELLGVPVKTTATPDGKISLDVGGKVAVADTFEHWAQGNPRKGKRAGFATLFSPQALQNYLSRSQQVEDQAIQTEQQNALEDKRFGRQLALQDRADARADRRAAPSQVTLPDGRVVERVGNEGAYRPVMVDDGSRPPPPSLAANGPGYDPASRFGGQPEGGPRPLRVQPGYGGRFGGAGAGAAAMNPFGNSADAQKAWMDVRAMAATDPSGTLSAMVESNPFAVYAMVKQLRETQADEKTRLGMAVKYLQQAQKDSALAVTPPTEAELVATARRMIDATYASAGAPAAAGGAGAGGSEWDSVLGPVPGGKQGAAPAQGGDDGSGYTVGQAYQDGDGNVAVYLGNGQWQEQ